MQLTTHACCTASLQLLHTAFGLEHGFIRVALASVLSRAPRMQVGNIQQPLLLENDRGETEELDDGLQCIDLTNELAATVDFSCIESIDYIWRITRSLPVRVLRAPPEDGLYRDSQLPEDVALLFEREVGLVSELLHQRYRAHLSRELVAYDQFHVLVAKQAAVLARSCQALSWQVGRQSSLDTDLLSDAGSMRTAASPKHPLKQDLATICLVPLIRACRELCSDPRQLENFSRILLEQLAAMFKLLMDRERYTTLDDAILPELREVFFACTRSIRDDGKHATAAPAAFQGPMGMLTLGVVWRSLGDLMLGLAMLIECTGAASRSQDCPQRRATKLAADSLCGCNSSSSGGTEASILAAASLRRKHSKSQLLR